MFYNIGYTYFWEDVQVIFKSISLEKEREERREKRERKEREKREGREREVNLEIKYF
jgi:hypothetical protein